MDVSNKFGISASVDGKITVLLPPRGDMTRDDALLFAAWLVLLADPLGQDFERTLTAVANG